LTFSINQAKILTEGNKKMLSDNLNFLSYLTDLFDQKFSCIADWRFREFFPCRKFHLAWGVPDESRAKQ
jgi:hypothetical protein